MEIKDYLTIEIDCKRIHDWNSFHNEFMRTFGFPDFYGRNMDAWIDCMSCLDDPESGMSKIHCKSGEVITFKLKEVSKLKDEYPEIFSGLIDCLAFVNYRRMEANSPPILSISYYS